MTRSNINASTATTNSMTQKLRQQQHVQIMSSLEQRMPENQAIVLLGDANFPIVNTLLASWDSYSPFNNGDYGSGSGDINVDNYEYQQRSAEMAEPTRKNYRE